MAGNGSLTASVRREQRWTGSQCLGDKAQGTPRSDRELEGPGGPRRPSPLLRPPAHLSSSRCVPASPFTSRWHQAPCPATALAGAVSSAAPVRPSEALFASLLPVLWGSPHWPLPPRSDSFLS